MLYFNIMFPLGLVYCHILLYWYHYLGALGLHAVCKLGLILKICSHSILNNQSTSKSLKPSVGLLLCFTVSIYRLSQSVDKMSWLTKLSPLLTV